ncbi:MAG: CRTAC1 family protein, partial [Planctomycetales bacterium]|nr:CRTAC1 family protein [Planctomycetales bacterium]
RREAEGGFLEVSDEIGAENYWPWGLSVGDVNADGFDDAFLASSMCFPYRYAANSLLLNQAGERWVDSEFALRVEPRPAGKRIRPWFVLDLDGEDQGNELGRDRTGRVVVWSTLGSRSSALLDIDGDGDLDLITNDFNSPPQLLVSDLAQRHSVHWLQVRLEGDSANRDGLGAVVRLEASGATQWKRHDGQSGYLAQSSMPLYFGLGAAEQVDRIEVTWPGGQTQTLDGPIPANQILHIKQQQP